MKYQRHLLYLLAGGDEEGTISLLRAVRLSCTQRILFGFLIVPIRMHANFYADF